MSGSEENAQLAQLLARAAAEDRAAFAELYRRTSAKLFGIARRMLQNASAAEEALQEAYVRIWSNAGRFDPQLSSPMTWMIAIVRNQAIDLRRKSAERISAGGVDLEDVTLVDPGGAAPDETADLRQLRECLGTLNEQSRSMVLLAYHLGMSREELSKRFDRPVATVKTILRRGLIALKECLHGRT